MTRGPALYSRSVTIWFHSECLSKCSLIHSTLAPPQPLKTKRALFGVSRKFPQTCIHQFATQVAVPAYYFNQLRKDGLGSRENPGKSWEKQQIQWTVDDLLFVIIPLPFVSLWYFVRIDVKRKYVFPAPLFPVAPVNAFANLSMANILQW